MIKKFITSRKNVLFFFDLCCFWVIYFACYLMSVWGISPVSDDSLSVSIKNAFVLCAIFFLTRLVMKSYSTVWRYTSTRAYLNIVISDMLSCVLSVFISLLLDIFLGIWYYIILSSLICLATLSSRFCYRLLYKRKKEKSFTAVRTPVAIVGAGQLGAYLANELKGNPRSEYNPLCFFDKKYDKIGNTVAGIRVFSDGNARHYLNEYNIREVIIAISNIDTEEKQIIYNYYNSLGCKVKIYDMPSLNSTAGSTDGKRIIREFSIEDLLFRKPVSINDSCTFDFYNGKTILVTGGGGSIGSELCRQIVKHNPKKLIIFDIYENNAYDIQQELLRKYGADYPLQVYIGSVRDRKRLETVFIENNIDIIFHAAAHKHVPLMEDSGCEAIKNNVLGTYNVADMAEKHKVKKFILISTDKAVNPTNIMGASKRLCEMVIQCRSDSETSFAAVRFGNVLGSNGSVIPLFKKQIADGGPVTITDKRIIRYFMTIPEASQLVMQAGAMAKKGELFVLDMGKPVKIYDLAYNMIKLSGLIPNEDIKIEEIGLRPGEKLYEELLIKTEHLEKTDSNMIFVEKDLPLSRKELDSKIEILKEAVKRFETDPDKKIIKDAIYKTVPTYKDPELVNKEADKANEMQMSAVVSI